MVSICVPYWVVVIVISSTCFSGLCEGASDHHDWGYGKRNGPRSWSGVCSTGSFQSPIDLSIYSAHPRHFEPLVFFAYGMHSNATITNNGHTVTVTMQQPCTAQIAGAGLPGPYSLAQVHFHWGSEHTVEDHRYPLEAHFVHYDSSRFKSVKEAVGVEDGLAVVGVLYRETNEPSSAISRVLQGVSGVMLPGSEIPLRGGLQLDQLLPRNTELFYRYRGSLTTPTCNEGVIWTVLVSHAPIAKEQIVQFKELKTHGSGKLELNYRPVQPLNDRILYIRSTNTATISSLCQWALLTIFALFIVN